MQHALLLLFALLAGCAATAVETPAEESATALWAEVDFACTVDADCAVRNIGNCCGYFPACVHRDSPVFPERVRDRCEAAGLSSICGFAEIDACACVAGRCQAAAAEADRTR